MFFVWLFGSFGIGMNFLESIPLCFSLISDDLCTECVEALRTEALFREQLHQIDLLMADTMRTLYLRYRTVH